MISHAAAPMSIDRKITTSLGSDVTFQNSTSIEVVSRFCNTMIAMIEKNRT